MSSNKPCDGPVKGPQHEPRKGFSRRTFIEGVGIGAGAVGAVGMAPEARADSSELMGPGPVPITLNINGKSVDLKVEPRVTLIDALRNQLDHTGAKKVCDRATCGACTVIVDGSPVYSCTLLAIEAQGRRIETIEGISTEDSMHPVQVQFVENDAQQCGFCTPGLVMAGKVVADRNPPPSMADVESALSGNICRCGTYVGVRKAVYEAARQGGA
ncbi:MAG: (2Fe-2S)-binding protein [Bryobacterales bacterium]|nr:(2Fe-2S)-binding protein [Bryobacterales bacterium]